MRIVVGCNLDQAGTHPLNINIGPSFCKDDLMTARVEFDPGPEAFMMRLCNESE
jgi:formylmethanofuran dehydrogenase subunit E-like metal-binding protein